MLNILRDPIWQFVGAVIAILGSLLTLGLFVLERKRKELAYTIAVNEELIKLAGEINDDFQILYKGKAVRNLRLLILEFRNSGNIPILPTDYIKPLVLNLNKANIVSAEIASVEPKDMDIATGLSASRITLKLGLLNPKDYIRVKILVSDYQGIEIKGRVIGVSSIKQREKRAELIPFYISALVTAFIFIGVELLSEAPVIRTVANGIALVILITLAATIVINVIRYEKRIRQ